MNTLSHLHPLSFATPPSSYNKPYSQSQFHLKFRISCSSSPPNSIKDEGLASKSDYKPGFLDNLFLNLFRKKMVEEVGRDSEKPGYDGLIEVANMLMVGRTSLETNEAAVRILRSLFPPYLLELFQKLITPIGQGKLAAVMVARVTAVTCQWLMGKCSVNSISFPDGSSCQSGVFVERCKYLEESKCVGICVNTCKLPTQAFFKDYMGIPLLMEPNFTDYSCQFNFGVPPPSPENESVFREPCLEICPNATRRRQIVSSSSSGPCPKS